MLTPIACSRCGFRVTPDDRTVRVVDEFGSNVRHELCAVELLEIPGITIVVPRPVAVTALLLRPPAVSPPPAGGRNPRETSR